MSDGNYSFEQGRKNMLEAVRKSSAGQEMRKSLPFRPNRDVAKFLARLDELEQRARKTRLVAD